MKWRCDLFLRKQIISIFVAYVSISIVGNSINIHFVVIYEDRRRKHIKCGGLTNNIYIRYVVPYQQYYISGTFILPWIHMKPDHIDTGVLIYTKALKGHGDLKKP